MIRAVARTAEEREYLARVAGGPPGRGLARAAVLLARTGCPGADPDRVEAILEGIAVEVRRRAGAAAEAPATAAARAAALSAVLAGDRGLRGTRAAGEDPRDSCLECVLDRGRGIPLSFSLLWMEAARRLGWRVDGVGLPGHFLVRVHGGGPDPEVPGTAIHPSVIADPFHGGEVLDRAGVRALLRNLHGEPVPLRAAWLAPAGSREVLLRMLRNLRGTFRRRGEREKALAVAEDMLLLAPGLPEALRDRGLLRVETGDRRRGVEDLRAYLGEAGRDGGADTVLRLLTVLTADAELPN